MDFPTFRSAFPRQLGHWTLHGLLNALPSLVIALGWMELRKSPVAIAAIFAAIFTFILGYSVLTSLKGPLAQPTHLLSRSIALGCRIRAVISLVSLLALTEREHMIFTPDAWCGFAAAIGVNWLVTSAGGQPLALFGGDAASRSGFLPIYGTTLLEGLILSFLLLMISFFVLLVLQAKQRRRAFAPVLVVDDLSATDSPAPLQK